MFIKQFCNDTKCSHLPCLLHTISYNCQFVAGFSNHVTDTVDSVYNLTRYKLLGIICHFNITLIIFFVNHIFLVITATYGDLQGYLERSI